MPSTSPDSFKEAGKTMLTSPALGALLASALELASVLGLGLGCALGLADALLVAALGLAAFFSSLLPEHPASSKATVRIKMEAFFILFSPCLFS